MTKEETAVAIHLIASLYPHWVPNKDTVVIFHDLLNDLDGEQVIQAVKILLQTSEKQPTVASIRKQVLSTTGKLPPTRAQAWEEVRVAVRKYGRDGFHLYNEFASEVVLKAVKTIGWKELCLSENVDITRAHFWKAYDEIVENSIKKVLTTPGLIKGSNKALEG
jgi:hypothetical protein